jgi:hypothetical protein
MPDRVRDACEANFDAHSGDCSGFARAVAAALGVELRGLANDIVDTLRGGGDWTALADGPSAAQAATAGKLVIAGLKGSEQADPDPNGHVVVVVAGPLARDKYPSAYWGKLHGTGEKDKTLNWAWTEQDRDRISYAAHTLDADSVS